MHQNRLPIPPPVAGIRQSTKSFDPVVDADVEASPSIRRRQSFQYPLPRHHRRVFPRPRFVNACLHRTDESVVIGVSKILFQRKKIISHSARLNPLAHRVIKRRNLQQWHISPKPCRPRSLGRREAKRHGGV